MANFYGTARSNYVRFDLDKLNALLELFPLTAHTSERHPGMHALVSNDEYGTPTIYLDEDDEEMNAAATILGCEHLWEEDVGLLDVIHQAFAEDPGGLFVWTEVGSEKARYLVGISVAIDTTGEIINQISLGDIYQTEDVNTKAEY